MRRILPRGHHRGPFEGTAHDLGHELADGTQALVTSAIGLARQFCAQIVEAPAALVYTADETMRNLDLSRRPVGAAKSSRLRGARACSFVVPCTHAMNSPCRLGHAKLFQRQHRRYCLERTHRLGHCLPLIDASAYGLPDQGGNRARHPLLHAPRQYHTTRRDTVPRRRGAQARHTTAHRAPRANRTSRGSGCPAERHAPRQAERRVAAAPQGAQCLFSLPPPQSSGKTKPSK